ncbi:MAG: class 1 fructose-bisphosphatase [Planctomycetes bacterium]|nr:class 1 fructose-bisphosphatase [Planctomycetota bacterium]
MSNSTVTIQRHIAAQQTLHPEATGQFTAMLWDLVLAFKMIAREVRRAGLIDILGSIGRTNVHGEKVQKLDEYAQDLIYHSMLAGGHVCCMASEERAEMIPLPRERRRGKHVLLYDPLDGSSNIDVNISIGTIFSIHKKVTPGADGALEDCLQPGTKQIAAGYVIYGSSVMLVYTTGFGVHGFTLDPTIGEFLLSHENIRMPARGKTYSINEGNSASFDPATAKYVHWIKQKDPETGRPYSLRYVGTLVADIHRTLINGGIFMYPAAPKPKLRLLYEGAPMAMIVEQAGGRATNGTQRILDIQPTDLHQKVPLIIGSPEDVEIYEEFIQGRDS